MMNKSKPGMRDITPTEYALAAVGDELVIAVPGGAKFLLKLEKTKSLRTFPHRIVLEVSEPAPENYSHVYGIRGEYIGFEFSDAED